MNFRQCTHTLYGHFVVVFFVRRQSSMSTMCSVAHLFHSLYEFFFVSRYCIVFITRLCVFKHKCHHITVKRKSHLLPSFSHSATFVIDNFIIFGIEVINEGWWEVFVCFLTTAYFTEHLDQLRSAFV